MLLDMWWLYVVGGALLAVVIFQAWDRRHNAMRFTRQEKIRTETRAARDAEGSEYAKQARPSLKS